MSKDQKKKKKGCRTLSSFEYFIILISAVSFCVSISGFDSLVSVSVGIMNFAVELKICAITLGIKLYKAILKNTGKSMILKKLIWASSLMVKNIIRSKYIFVENGKIEI